MHNSDSASLKRRQLENDERSSGSRPPLPSSYSMPLSLYSGEASSVTAGSSRVVRRMTRTRSSPTPLGHDVSEEDEDRRDSHDLSISPRAFGRESLVDNLLLSFDKFGNGDLGFDSAFFNPTSELDDDAATTSSQQTGYSTRGRRSNSSSNFHSHLGRLPTHGSGGSRAFGSFDYGTVPAGYGLNYGREQGRETFSRSGTSAGTLNSFVNTEYDPAPTPTVHSGPRDRSVTLESATKIERRGSIKSTRSSRKLQDHHLEEKMTLPPMPAFHSPAPTPATPVKQSGKPSFFRRVFGGGSSSSSNNNNKSKTQQHVEATEQKIVHSQQQQDVPVDPIPPATINKKPSFFRRRKKSMSEANSQHALPLPPQVTRDELQYDQSEPSPISSLRAVMNPYLRTPAIPAAMDLEFDPEPPYSQFNSTIRTVQTSEPGSPNRPTYFGESRARRDSETHFASTSSPNLTKTSRYSKESKPSKGASSELTLDMPTPTKKSLKEDRPQTSPHSPLSLKVGPSDDDSMWPPPLLAIRKSMESLAIEKEKQREMDASVTARRPSVIAQEKPIATVKDIELQHAQLEQKRRESRGSGPLSVDVNVGGFAETGRLGSSWLATPTPLSTGSAATTPTVMLQVEAGGDIDTESEPAEADLSELLGGDEATENEKLFVKKIFDGDEEFITKARAAAWLGTA